MRIVHALLLLLFALAVLTFALQNLQAVAVSFPGLIFEAPLALVVIVIYVVGMLTGGAVVAFLRYSMRRATHRARKDAQRYPAVR